MDGYSIGAHVQAADPAAVRQAVSDIFAAQQFADAGEADAAEAVADEVPEGEYGVMLSGAVGRGWVSVYVADWQDSGVLARELSARLTAAVLEVWIAEDVHWGYTYFEDGEVRDRFADDPAQVAETPAEEGRYAGRASSLARVLTVPAEQAQAILEEAHQGTAEYAGEAVSALAEAAGLPFEHALIGYDDFFEQDPDDYAQDLTDWPAFRHLTFRPPAGRQTLAA